VMEIGNPIKRKTWCPNIEPLFKLLSYENVPPYLKVYDMRFELNDVEARSEHYMSTISFLNMLNSLIIEERDAIDRGRMFIGIFRFIYDHVVGLFSQSAYADPFEKWVVSNIFRWTFSMVGLVPLLLKSNSVSLLVEDYAACLEFSWEGCQLIEYNSDDPSIPGWNDGFSSLENAGILDYNNQGQISLKIGTDGAMVPAGEPPSGSSTARDRKLTRVDIMLRLIILNVAYKFLAFRNDGKYSATDYAKGYSEKLSKTVLLEKRNYGIPLVMETPLVYAANV
ncbi:nuclear pore complex protein NUP205, partial [Tanacetum coccineum]